MNSASEKYETIKHINISIMGVSEREESEREQKKYPKK